jgi:hypothetical protein
MRKFVLSLAAAGAAFVAASPAAAQYNLTPRGYASYGYNGYNGYNNYGQIRALQVRIDNVERQISRLDRRDTIRDRSADRLRDEANKIERRLHDRARGGLNQREAYDIQTRIARLEQRVQYAVANNSGRYNGRWHDRDND